MDRPASVDDWLELVVRLGREFSTLGMIFQCEKLRLYYRAFQQQLDADQRRTRGIWPDDVVIEWMRTLRLPPYEHYYPVEGNRCKACGSLPDLVYVQAIFPGGAKLICDRCHRAWLALNDAR